MINEVKKNTAQLLKNYLADQHVVYMRARNFHWNVVGPQFFGLHTAFEKVYDALAEDIDEIAERIRVLDVYAPGTMKELLELASLKEEPGKYPDSKSMVQILANDLDALALKALSSAKTIAGEYNDEVSASILIEQAQEYQKTYWMLKSTLSNE